MAAAFPAPLAENAGLAFAGEPVWPDALLSAREAAAMQRARNACGRPNHDVLRRRLGVVDGAPRESWQIDFPAHCPAQEASLYERPWAHLQRRGAGPAHPQARPELRRALARLSRFLALPAAAEAPDWRWIEDEVLPDDSLVVVAREDDFTHGLLASRVFGCWVEMPPGPPDWVAAVASFPFPWPPATLLGALTREQEESRHAVARAVRGGDAPALEAAARRAYGWDPDASEEELRPALRARHRQRAGAAG